MNDSHGQIKINGKVYAEQNHPRTCTTSGAFMSGKLVVAAGTNTLKTINTQTAGVFFINANGLVDFLPVPEGEAGRNKLLSVLANGQLGWTDIERS